MITFLKRFFNTLAPDYFFVSCAVVFGIIFLIVTPPFQSPDEFNHFYRAYQISEGHLTAIKKDNRLGGELPLSLVKISEPFRAMPMKGYITTQWSTIAAQFEVPLHAEERIFIDFPNTGMYSPVSYLPQSLSIFVLRTLNLPPLYIFYGARLFTLFFWIFCMTFIIRLLPFYKWLFTLLALLPMSVFTHMSLSADVMTNLLSFAVIAYSFDLAYEQTIFSTRQLLVFTGLGVLLALAKVVYLPLILLFFLIPQKKFGSQWLYYSCLFILFSLSLATAILWSIEMKILYTPYSLYNPHFRDGSVMITCLPPCANMQEQLHYILSHGWYVIVAFIETIYNTFKLYSRGIVGTFGWLDTEIPTGIVVWAYGVLFFTAMFSGPKEIRKGRRFKFLLCGCFSIILILILLSQLLTWSCVGSEFIYIIQGRYLVPILPLLFLLLYIPQWHVPQVLLSAVIFIFVGISLVYSSFLLYNRYFNEKKIEISYLACDAEMVTGKNYTTTGTLSATIENGVTRSNEKAHSGKHSAKISFKNPYTFTSHLSDCRWGDSITVDVMRSGSVGGIIISADDNSFYSQYTVDPIEKDSLGWEHLQAKFMVPHHMEDKISIYMYYKKGSDSSYFDDIKIVYRKLK
jgi:uncharacterized membrane protein